MQGSDLTVPAVKRNQTLSNLSQTALGLFADGAFPNLLPELSSGDIASYTEISWEWMRSHLEFCWLQFLQLSQRSILTITIFNHVSFSLQLRSPVLNCKYCKNCKYHFCMHDTRRQ